MSVTLGNNQIGASTEEKMKNTPAGLFCSVFLSCCTASMAEVVIREMKRGNRNEHELVVNVLVLSICM